MSSDISSAALPAPAVAAQPPAAGRGLALWIVAISHGFNHLQGNMYNVLYPVMMAEMGFGYFQIGLLTMAFTITVNGLQVIWGFFTPYVPRAVLLGCGNSLMAIVTAATGLVQQLPPVGRRPRGQRHRLQPSAPGRLHAARWTVPAGARTGPGAAHHRVECRYAGRAADRRCDAPRGRGLARHLLRRRRAEYDLRTRLLPDPRARAGLVTTKRGARVTLDTYKACLRNRNLVIVSLVQMVGAAGRGQGIDIAFLTPHFVNDFGIPTATATLLIAVLQFGGLFGPLLMGWLSDPRLAQGHPAALASARDAHHLGARRHRGALPAAAAQPAGLRHGRQLAAGDHPGAGRRLGDRRRRIPPTRPSASTSSSGSSPRRSGR